MMSAILVYITVASDEEAHKIARAVIKDRLAACANIIPGMRSIYHWQGKIEESAEVLLLFKTREELFPSLRAKVKKLHSAEIPCIVAYLVTAANQDYMHWIFAETKA
jgi:periplasmic divalent cation tolerance protein